ncbi:hypothetical protein BKA70DRAFT_1441131 [Coprinopsis sp. MPI-PUGE-AT-0042]|nr:hypothetical protein BKA70DRAFT_1441131 [Coprinopsis sp. MPI-PUGE-AT-0042]
MAKTHSPKILSAKSDTSKTGKSRGEDAVADLSISCQSARWEPRKAEAEKRIRENTVTALIVEHPGTFDSFPYSGERLRNSLRSLFPDGAKANLKVAPRDGIFMVKPDAEAAKSLPEGHAGLYLLRVDNVIPENSQETFRHLFREVQRHAVPRCTENGNRSATNAYHFGVWIQLASRPFRTSRRPCEKVLSPRIKMFNRRYADKSMIKRLEKAHKYVNSTLGNSEHYVDLGGSFFAIAAKEGSSERLHLDFRDDHRTLSWLVPLGHLPVVTSSYHSSDTGFHAVSEGTRIAFTLFSDANIMAQSE